jgi:cation diffusion facilitator family transporter
VAGGEGESAGAILAAFLANMGIAATKFVGFIITGSSSLLAEAIHSVADSSNQGLLFFGGRQAQRPADELHQFGHGRERFFWAFVVSVVLFSLGGLFSVYEGYHKIRDPHELESGAVAVVILLVAMVLESFALRARSATRGPPAGIAPGCATSASRAAPSCRCC